MSAIHPYSKLLFPARRERRFVRRHRARGHTLRHYGNPELAARCYWQCSCMRKRWC